MKLKKIFSYLAAFFAITRALPHNVEFQNDEKSALLSVSLQLMDTLALHQGIIISEEGNNKIKNIHDFKIFSSKFILIKYSNVKELLNYFLNDSSSAVRTAIIFKGSNIDNVIWILEELEKVSDGIIVKK